MEKKGNVQKECRFAQPGSRLMLQIRISKNLETKGRKCHLCSNSCIVSLDSGQAHVQEHLYYYELEQRLPKGKGTKLSAWAPGSISQTSNRSALSPQSRFPILGIFPLTRLFHLNLKSIFHQHLLVRQGRLFCFTEQRRESKGSDFWVYIPLPTPQAVFSTPYLEIFRVLCHKKPQEWGFRPDSTVLYMTAQHQVPGQKRN